MIAASRQTASLSLLRSLAWASRLMYGRPNQPGLHRLRVLAGPLRGTYLSTPALTRLSFCLGTYQRDVVALMKRYVAPGITAYDLGAHMGYFSLVLANLVGPAGRVFSFEPDPHNLRALRSNLESNRKTNVTVTPAAIADECGEVTFASFPFSSVSHIADSRTPGDALRIPVPALTLDAFVYSNGNPAPDFIKIDVEGAEARVFRGAERVLRETVPVVVVEAWRSHWDEVAALMRDFGYRAHVLGGEGQMSRAGVADVLFLPSARDRK